MSVATNNILKLLSELSALADKVADERASEFKTPRLLEWISIVENKADDIAEGKSSTESEEMPNLVQYLRGSIEKGARASTVLTEIQRLHLHKKESRKSRHTHTQLILKTPLRHKSSVKKRVSVQSTTENIPTPKLKVPPIVIKKTGIGFYQNVNRESTTSSIERTKISATATPVSSSKRKSSSELLLENVKKPKTHTNADQLDARSEQPREKSMQNPRVEKQIQAKNSSILPNYGNNIKSSVGPVTNVLKENRNLRSKMEAKQEKAVENRKNIMALRQQKLEENKRNRELKLEKTFQERLKLDKQKEQKMGKLRSGHTQEKIMTPKAMQKIVSENNDKEKQMSSPVKKLQLNLKKIGTSEKTPVLCVQKNIKKHKTEKVLNSTYVAKPLEESSTSNKGKTFIDSNLGAIKAHEKTVKQLTNLTNTITPVEKKGSESYAITPARTSFVSYDISEIRSDSEDDEQETNSKPIPSWATGVRLRNALLQQHHHPIDTDELFGNVVDLPDLAVIMGVKKKHYNKRTSSAVWNSSFSFS